MKKRILPRVIAASALLIVLPAIQPVNHSTSYLNRTILADGSPMPPLPQKAPSSINAGSIAWGLVSELK